MPWMYLHEVPVREGHKGSQAASNSQRNRFQFGRIGMAGTMKESKAKTVREVLVAAKWIIENVGWCQEYYATDAEGNYAIYDSKAACHFCPEGAVNAVLCDKMVRYEAIDLLDRLVPARLIDKDADSNIVIYNDTPGRTLKQVLKTFDVAIKRAA